MAFFSFGSNPIDDFLSRFPGFGGHRAPRFDPDPFGFGTGSGGSFFSQPGWERKFRQQRPQRTGPVQIVDLGGFIIGEVEDDEEEQTSAKSPFGVDGDSEDRPIDRDEQDSEESIYEDIRKYAEGAGYESYTDKHGYYDGRQQDLPHTPPRSRNNSADTNTYQSSPPNYHQTHSYDYTPQHNYHQAPPTPQQAYTQPPIYQQHTPQSSRRTTPNSPPAYQHSPTPQTYNTYQQHQPQQQYTSRHPQQQYTQQQSYYHNTNAHTHPPHDTTYTRHSHSKPPPQPTNAYHSSGVRYVPADNKRKRSDEDYGVSDEEFMHAHKRHHDEHYRRQQQADQEAHWQWVQDDHRQRSYAEEVRQQEAAAEAQRREIRRQQEILEDIQRRKQQEAGYGGYGGHGGHGGHSGYGMQSGVRYVYTGQENHYHAQPAYHTGY